MVWTEQTMQRVSALKFSVVWTNSRTETTRNVDEHVPTNENFLFKQRENVGVWFIKQKNNIKHDKWFVFLPPDFQRIFREATITENVFRQMKPRHKIEIVIIYDLSVSNIRSILRTKVSVRKKFIRKNKLGLKNLFCSSTAGCGDRHCRTKKTIVNDFRAKTL